MEVKDLKQENSRIIVEKIIENLKIDEDGGARIGNNFVFCFEKDDDFLRTITNALPTMLLQLMEILFETLQKKSPVTASVAERTLKGKFSQKKDAD